MAEPQKIVLLYKKSSIPEPVLKQAQAQTPKGFTFTPCEAATPEREPACRPACAPTWCRW